MYPNLHGESGTPFCKTTQSTPDRDSNLDFPIIGHIVYYESCALDHVATKADERRLGMDEKPLLVQLNWHMDDREGRFLLRRIDDKTHMPSVGFSQEGASSFRRKLSKREKKQLKKQEKINKLKSAAPINENDSGVAEKLYIELPETSFTRSISNPEAVMRRRRQQKLERKLQQFRSKDGGPDTGGTLKIYGESLCQDVPYKTLLLSVRDTAQQVVKEMLAKYGLEKEMDPHNYCLVQEHIKSFTDNEICSLLNMRRGGLLVIHGSLRTGVESVNWDINCILLHMYYLFTDYSSLSIVYPVDRVYNFSFEVLWSAVVRECNVLSKGITNLVNAATAADSGESKEYHGGTNNREYILDDDECPLAILMNHPLSRANTWCWAGQFSRTSSIDHQFVLAGCVAWELVNLGYTQ
ncbi:unnamed protein product [Timema podura]|uniref:Ras-associating domain-containing protein n=1 Tax=Timema podura TaxID=61482 RepID=A0ABN7NE11_TIMPD|nr:unnamed protein product [Timema podura]